MGDEQVNNDELTAFVVSTLRAISAGISQASMDAMQQSQSSDKNYGMPDKISFDIAIVAKRSSEGAKGWKVEVFSVGANLGDKSLNHSETASRITFAVPWQYNQKSAVEFSSSRVARND